MHEPESKVKKPLGVGLQGGQRSSRGRDHRECRTWNLGKGSLPCPPQGPEEQ